jgi:uncharacterized protein
VLITGATSGVGREISLLLARCDSVLFPCGQDINRMVTLVHELEREGGGCPKSFLADLSNQVEMKRFIENVKSSCTRIDVLIQCAGFNYFGDFAAMPEDTATSMLVLHTFTMTSLCRAFFPEMIRKREGGILNIGSVASFFPTPGALMYGATKHFQVAFTDALHREGYDFNVHVTGMYPGNIRTRFLERATGGRLTQWSGGMDPRLVAEQGLEGLSRNEMRVVPGLIEKIRVLVAIHGPVSWILCRAYRHAKKYYDGEVNRYVE